MILKFFDAAVTSHGSSSSVKNNIKTFFNFFPATIFTFP